MNGFAMAGQWSYIDGEPSPENAFYNPAPPENYLHGATEFEETELALLQSLAGDYQLLPYPLVDIEVGPLPQEEEDMLVGSGSGPDEGVGSDVDDTELALQQSISGHRQLLSNPFVDTEVGEGMGPRLEKEAAGPDNGPDLELGPAIGHGVDSEVDDTELALHQSISGHRQLLSHPLVDTEVGEYVRPPLEEEVAGPGDGRAELDPAFGQGVGSEVDDAELALLQSISDHRQPLPPHPPVYVLLGRGTRVNVFPGNNVYRGEISRFLDYHSSLTKPQKTRLVHNLVESLLSRGFRFLRQEDGQEEDKKEVLCKKVSHSFRTLKKGRRI
ncbi:unnamed protein product [Cylindrotheca closterium]|uniref:DUF6824 domain-containing protein n=1 Tax=Cylindrotheca closterium TaxID=2856 RepID=A0AAD2CPW8_9STRA|nr:unnamed protein product [Cylindrotheca closterium]